MVKIPEKTQKMKIKLDILKDLLKKNNIDGYIIPRNDETFLEYSLNNRLSSITNFDGSAGFALVLKHENYLFVDGRYTIQAKIQSGKYFKIIEIPKTLPSSLFSKYNKKLNIGFDPKIFTNFTLINYFKSSCNLIPVSNNLIDQIVIPKTNVNNHLFYNLDDKISGENVYTKINKINKILNSRKIDNIFISAAENAAWILNIRGKDIPNSPIPICSLIITKTKEVFIFTDLLKIKNLKKINTYKKFKFYETRDFFKVLCKIKGKNFSIDKNSCSIFLENLISSKFKIKNTIDPCYQLKAIKNNAEIKNMEQSHIYDGVAVTKFLYWIKKYKKNNLTELDVEKKLENFRKQNKTYLYPSFNTIAGSGPNGAIIHYRATKKSNRKIKKNDILLIDSGGQYKYGTTDITRTICFKKPSKKIKEIFTRVLKGHIAVACTNLDKVNTGNQIDKSARKYLNDVNLDYGHGTGHGVGFFLNVHEGPQAISKFNTIKIREGMILSNEPGYYKENKFGIRIENLVYAKKIKRKLKFSNLTFAPLDKDLIIYDMLNKNEKNYLFKYHLDTYSKVSSFLNKKEKQWLQNLI